MSQLPGGEPRSEQTTPQLSPTQSFSCMQPPHRNSRRDGPGNSIISLPSLRELSKTPPTPSDKRYGHVLGVHSILNPQMDQTEQPRSRRRSASQMESPSPVESLHPQNLPSISRRPSVERTQSELNSSRQIQPLGKPTARHRLTALSPRLHKPKSLGILNAPTGTIDAHQSPFLSGSIRPSDPGASQPALPTPPVVSRGAYFPPGLSMAPTPPHSNRAEVRRPSANYSQSGSASPMTHYSSYSRSTSVASGYENLSSQGHYMAMPPNAQVQDGQNSTMSIEHNMIPMAPSAQSSIQLMTIKSQQGHPVQIPVDVQAASKVADEKRRRNAGASARFRARRKEKEREASVSISRLEQQLRNALEDADYYRGERDHFKSVLYQQPGAERHCARPSSPRLRRLSISISHPTSPTTVDGSEESYAGYEEESHDSERNVRRRTSSYHPVVGPSPTEFNNPSDNYSAPMFSSANRSTIPGSSPIQHAPPQEQGLPRQSYLERPDYRGSFGSDAGRYQHRY
ncbi:hypothetical protein P153DRAFT_285140 [Dothidotthia symphoricarpi CBS 119687]|uniref:BZIP domain-containing protein n=1 Tax=Dothidotthia symphoricarpi CBS 119687 TaxID=1392245 RepID=A0A6A6AJQ1_9PLEO|nr:uncharacterized protein P153DRAFT_285140 [Dothidotthia symphoricarpi CBS 119687]KAF2132179.1 hypothetical protein P153DRAFT_285140 [Dothidotthia symphoricarpi CBS 119687]